MVEPKEPEAKQEHLEACHAEIREIQDLVAGMIGAIGGVVQVLTHAYTALNSAAGHLEMVGAMRESRTEEGVDFPGHIHRALERAGFGTVEELVAVSREEAQARAGFSDSDMMTVQWALKKAGLSLLSENKPQDLKEKP